MERWISELGFYNNGLKTSMIVILILMVIFSLSYIVLLSPYFASMLIRAIFSMTKQTPPVNYEQVKQKITIYKDIKYPSKYGSNVLDIYLPRGVDKPPKTIIYVHGGGYVGGDKKETRYFASSLAAKGYAVISINYERAPQAHYPGPLIQLGEAYAFIQANNQYNLDISNLTLAGSSVGAHCVTQFVTVQASKKYADLVGVKQIVPFKNIRELLLYCGPYDFERFGTQSKSKFINFMMERYMWGYFGTRDWRGRYGHLATLKYHITSDFPPTFITDGNKGSFEQDGKELEQRLLEKRVAVESYYIDIEHKKVGHEYQYKMETAVAEEGFTRTIEFLDKHTK